MAEAEEVSETKPELSLVCQSEIVFCEPGDDVVLSCHLKPAISAVSMEIMWWNKEDLVCHYKDGQITMSKDFEGRVNLSLEDIHNGNVSLTLRDVRRSQKGLYICEVIYELQTLQDTVFLHITSEDFSILVPNDTVSAAPGSDVILPVHLSPETSAVSMTVRWFRETELIYQYMNGQEKTNDSYEHRLSLSIQELERGNLSLTLRNVQESDSGKYTCKVFHDGCLQTVHLQVRVEQINTMLEQKQQIQELPSVQHPRIQFFLQEMHTRVHVSEGESFHRLRQQFFQLYVRMLLSIAYSLSECSTHEPLMLTGERPLQREIVEQQRQIKKLEQEKLKMERLLKELERRIEDLERQIKELPLPTHTSHGPTLRRRDSIDTPPRLGDDDETPMTPETEEQREATDTRGVERESGDQNTRQTREETTVTEQETPGTSPQF